MAFSGLSNVSARIKSSSNLTGNRSEMPNFSYTITVVVHVPGDSAKMSTEIEYWEKVFLSKVLTNNIDTKKANPIGALKGMIVLSVL